MDPLQAGDPDTVGRYRLLGRLGEGGMGRVYLGRTPSLHRLTLGLAEALSAIHAAGLVHRDLKPANVLLAADGARVIDFGIAHSSGVTMIGTPEFMSPEQVAGTGPPGAAGDVFSMGATLCFAATGRGPFAAGNGAAVLYKVLEAEPDLRGMPAVAADIARRCLVKDPARRPTAPQVAMWLRGMATPPPAPMPPRVSRAGRRRALVVTGAVVGVVLLAGATALAVSAGDRGGGPVVTPTPTPPVVSDVDPTGPEAQYVERLCEGGDLLIDISESTGSITTTGDPTVARQEYLDAAARTISTIDIALIDYQYQRDNAPSPTIATGSGWSSTSSPRRGNPSWPAARSCRRPTR